MRRLLILAPLLLTSCAFLYPSGTPTITQVTMHDGYELTCSSTDATWFDDCEAIADDAAAQYRLTSPSPITLIHVTEGGIGSICSRTPTGATECEEFPVPSAAP